MNNELINIFLDEAKELLDLIIGAQDKKAANYDETIKISLQNLHTLKGGSKMVGKESLSELAHSLEKLFLHFSKTNSYSEEHKRFAKIMLLKMKDYVYSIESSSVNPVTDSDVTKINDFIKANSKSCSELEVSQEICNQIVNGCDVLAKKIHAFNAAATVDESNKESLTHLISEIDDLVITLNLGQQKLMASALKKFSNAIKFIHDNNKIITANILSIFIKVELALVDSVHKITAKENVTSFPDFADEIYISYQIKSLPARKKAKEDALSSQNTIRVSREKIEAFSRLCEKIRLQGINSQSHISNLLHKLIEIEKNIKLSFEAAKQLELNSDLRAEELSKDKYDEFDWLELDRYNATQNLTRRLTNYLNEAEELIKEFAYNTKNCDSNLEQQNRITSSLEQALMHERMLSLSDLLPRFQTIVKQISSELNKSVELVFVKAQGEIDRSIFQKLLPAFEHLIRNAIDHGIESPKQRLELGKAEHGKIMISMTQQGNQVVFEFSDDGSGINQDKIIASAIKAGIISDPQVLSQQDIYKIILQTGFTTKKEATTISGRGMGMDIVNTIVKNLGGNLNIYSKEQKGTTFVITLPAMTTFNRALIFTVNDIAFAMPIEGAKGVILAPAEHKESITYLNSEYKYVSFANIFGLKEKYTPEKKPVLLLENKHFNYAVAVDKIVDIQEILIKPLNTPVQVLTEYIGASVLADGLLALVLDADNLLLRASDFEICNLESKTSACEQAMVLVVDDSATVRNVTSALLKRHHFEVTTAQDGFDALNKIKYSRPDIVLLDLEMPHMDGFEFIACVKSHKNLANIPIIVISSRTGEKYVSKSLSMGANAYFTKPYIEDKLIAKINSLLSGNSYEQAI